MSDLAARIEAVIEPPADELVVRFFEPTRGFAASTFDDLGDNRPDRLTADDLLATTLLDMRFPPRAVRAILGHEADHLAAMLQAIPTDVDLWEATDEDLAPAYALWTALRARGKGWGIGPTTTSKLMARKRPRLVPIVDSVVRDALGFEKDSWAELRAALQGSDLPVRIEGLRRPGVGDKAATLRLLDVAVWMRCSQGKAARAARTEVGLDE